MKQLFLALIALTITSCSAQEVLTTYKGTTNLNYVLANLKPEKTVQKTLFKGSFYLKAFLISDNDKISEGTDEVYDAYFISISPDGDYYTSSKLFKIEKLIMPKILKIETLSYPTVQLTIETGKYDNRITKIVTIKCN